MTDIQKYIMSSSEAIVSVPTIFHPIQKRIDLPAVNMSQRVKMLPDYDAYNVKAEFYERVGKAFQSIGDSSVHFQQNLTDLSVRTGITGKSLDTLSANARQLGISTGLGANEALKAYQVLASQVELSKVGLEGLNVLQGQTMILAKASGMEVEGAATALSGTINQFGLEATEANRVINVLAAGARFGTAAIPELSQALGVVGATAQSVGLDVESAAGALEVLSRGNLKGAEAGNALSTIMQRMQSALGIDFDTTSLATGLDSLKPKLNDLTYLTQLFGEGNVSAAQYLIANTEAVREMTDKVTGSNVAQEQAEIRAETVASRMAVMRERIDNLKYSIFEMTGGWSGYLSIIGETMGGVANFIPLIGLFSQMHTANAVATNVATGAQMKLNLAFLASPVTWIILGIVALVGTIVWLCSKITGWGSLWKGIVGGMKHGFMAFVESIELYWSTWINGFMMGINVIMKGWYRFKNAMGLGDENDNNAAIAKIDADTEARKQALVDVTKKMVENVIKAKESFAGIQMGWKGDEGTAKGATAEKKNSGISSITLPGTGNASLIPTYQTTSPAVVGQSSERAMTGGTRSTNVTISLGKLMDHVNIYAQEFRDGLNELDDKVLESLTRVLNMAQSSVI